jgi:hypothetical protein
MGYTYPAKAGGKGSVTPATASWQAMDGEGALYSMTVLRFFPLLRMC